MDDVSLADMAQSDNHENNTIAEDYDNEYSIDDLVQSVIMKTDDFSLASSIERSEVVKALLGTIVLPIYAYDSMWNAVDSCNDGINQQDTSEWDKAVASLVGFLRTAKGTMIYGVGQLMCLTAGTCNEGEEAEVNEELLKTLEGGKVFLQDGSCMSAQAVVQYQIVMYLQVSLANLSTVTPLNSQHFLTTRLFLNIFSANRLCSLTQLPTMPTKLRMEKPLQSSTEQMDTVSEIHTIAGLDL